MTPILTFRTIGNTPVHVEKGGFFAWLSALPLLAWTIHLRHRDWPWRRCSWVTLWVHLALLVADWGHASAHVVSARRAGAPMDEIRVPLGMPRTLYRNNDVPPQVHRMRSLGGPIFSLAMLGLSLLVRTSLPEDSGAREVADWSCIGHGFIGLGSLTPFPMVDGGVILKWTLVEQGRTPKEADKAVEQAGLAVSGGAAAAGAVMASRRRWGWALGLFGLALLGVGMAKGKVQ